MEYTQIGIKIINTIDLSDFGSGIVCKANISNNDCWKKKYMNCLENKVSEPDVLEKSTFL